MELLLTHTPDDAAGAPPAIDLEVVAKRKQTALHLASDHGEDEAVEVLIRYGANLEAVDAHGETPLDLADNEEIREMLLEALEAKRAGEEAAAEVAQEAAEAEAAAEVVAEAGEAAAATTKEGKEAGEGVLGYAALVAENAALKGEVARLRAGVRAQAEAMRALLV